MCWPSAVMWHKVDTLFCRRRSKQSQGDLSAAAQPVVTHPVRNHKAAARKDNLLHLAMASQHAQAVRLVVDALVNGSFSKASVMQHMYEALQALIHDQQVSQWGWCE